MIEDEARDWIAARFGKVGIDRLERFAALVIAESEEQNLIARSTIPEIWARHIVDSAQLIDHAGGFRDGGLWLDIGSGAGFPGLVIAVLTERPVVLAEPRKRRVAFLTAVAEALGVADRVTVFTGKVDALRTSTSAAVISARAVAPLTNLLEGAINCASPETIWVLPKGQSARDEVAIAQRAWHGMFHVEHSVTNPESLIVVARGVVRRCKS